MKYGINLMLWDDDMHDGLLPTLENLKRLGYDGVEVPMFDLDPAKWEHWHRRLDDLGLERTANHVIAPEFDPVSPSELVRDRAYEHMTKVVDCCYALGAPILAGPHQIALGVFSGRGPSDQEWERSVSHIRRVAEYAGPAGVTLTEEVVNRFELYLLNTLAQASRFIDEVGKANCRIHFDTFHAETSRRSFQVRPSGTPGRGSAMSTSPRTIAESQALGTSPGTRPSAHYGRSVTTDG